MTDWTHEIGQVEHDMLLDSLLRAAYIAQMMEQTADDLDPDAVRAMAAAIHQRVIECVAFGKFDEEDVKEAHKEVVASMVTKPDA